jgi:hypothetical protein
LSVKRGDGCAGFWVGHDHKVAGFASESDGGLQSNLKAFFKNFGRNGSGQIQTLWHRPSGGQHMVHTGKIKTGDIHLLSPEQTATASELGYMRRSGAVALHPLLIGL